MSFEQALNRLFIVFGTTVDMFLIGKSLLTVMDYVVTVWCFTPAANFLNAEVSLEYEMK